MLVAGDLMLDRFIVGDVTRISPEAPVPVVRFQSEHTRLGGAANVALNLATLGARVSVVGMIGADRAGHQLRGHLDASGIDALGLVEVAGRPTVEKVRIVTPRNQQVARIDYEEDADASGDLEQRIIDAIERVADGAAVLLVSDYLKGTITRDVVRALVSRKATGAPLLVDPKIPHLACYAGATLITPNHAEAEAATHRRIRSDDDAREAGVEAFVSRMGALARRGHLPIWRAPCRWAGTGHLP